MRNNAEISVTYKYYIPDDWVKELEDSLATQGIQLKKEKDKEEYYDFTGPELADIILFIRDNPESIFLAPALYDIVKAGLIGLWKTLRTLIVNKIRSGSDSETKGEKISVRYQDSKDRRIEIEINIEKNINDDLIEDIIDKSLEVLKSNKKEEIFNQPEYVDNSQGRPRMELKYNPETEKWEPVNFGEIRRKMEEYQRWAEENLPS